MGAVESLDRCCNDRREEKTDKKYIGSWRAPTIKSQRELNTDYGNGPAICDEPLKDLKLDKSIDAEITAVFKEVGHRFPLPIHGQDQLIKILQGFRARGFSFTGSDEQLCAKVWSMHQCSRITILQFRAWFQVEATSCQNNLRVLLCHSRYVSDLIKRMYSESKHEDDKIEGVRAAVNSLRHHLDNKPASSSDILMTARQVIERNGKTNYLVCGGSTILIQDFEALVIELLVQLYDEHFNDSLYSLESHTDIGLKLAPDMKLKTNRPKLHVHMSGSSACLPGVDRWRRVSDTLPLGEAVPGKDRSARSLKFPISAAAA